jgi:xanthine dehydrogenase small subunit
VAQGALLPATQHAAGLVLPANAEIHGFQVVAKTQAGLPPAREGAGKILVQSLPKAQIAGGTFALPSGGDTMASETRLILNGQAVASGLRPDTTVLDFLRGERRLVGSKEGCAEGDCGACTILFSPAGHHGPPRAVNSCIMTLAQAEGGALTTIEGIGRSGALSVLQDEMARNGASQCGFCTPGIVMALSGLLALHRQPSEAQIHDTLAGNLCRCTGYRPIVEATKSAAARLAGSDPVLFAAATQAASKTMASAGSVLRPRRLRALLAARRDKPDAVLLAGGTDLGVARAAYEADWPQVITTGHVRELRAIGETAGQWTFGAAVTWEEILRLVADALPSLATLIRRFGSKQIRAMATIGGNIASASPIGDGPPALIALGARIRLASLDGGHREMALEDFFLDYRKTELRWDEVIVSVSVPKPGKNDVFRVWKVSKRYDQDISTVCGAFHLSMRGSRIVACRIAYGGMAATPKRAPAMEAALSGEELTAEVAGNCAKAAARDFEPLSDWRGTADYRLRVAASLPERLRRDLGGETVEVMAL